MAQICQLYRHTPTRTHIYGLLTSTTLEISPNSSHLLSIDLIRSILHYTLYTIHHVLSTLCYILYSIHHTPCTIHYILYTIHIRSTASRWLCVFFDSWDVVDDIGCARASRIVCYFLCKGSQHLIYRQRNEEPFRLHETSIFVLSSQPHTNWFPRFFSRLSLLFTAALQVLPRTF